MVKDHTDSEGGNPLPPVHGLHFLSAARILLYAPSHRQDSTVHVLCYTSRGALTGARNSLMVPLSRIDPMPHRPTDLHIAHGKSKTKDRLLVCLLFAV